MNLNLLSNVTIIMKSSIRARPSPRHTRGPKTQNKNLPSFTPGLKVGAFSLRYPRWPTEGAAPHGLVPAEKGMKASGLTNSPSSLRKFCGLNSFGNFHCPSSFRTEARCGMTSVPLWKESDQRGHTHNLWVSVLNPSMHHHSTLIEARRSLL